MSSALWGALRAGEGPEEARSGGQGREARPEGFRKRRAKAEAADGGERSPTGRTESPHLSVESRTARLLNSESRMLVPRGWGVGKRLLR